MQAVMMGTGNVANTDRGRLTVSQRAMRNIGNLTTEVFR
jgi:hypothetical protein